MQVRRNRNLVECIMDSEDLEKYNLDIDELKDPSSKVLCKCNTFA